MKELNKTIDIGSILKISCGELVARVHSINVQKIADTGFTCLDVQMDGIKNNDTIVVGEDPQWGKHHLYCL